LAKPGGNTVCDWDGGIIQEKRWLGCDGVGGKNG